MRKKVFGAACLAAADRDKLHTQGFGAPVWRTEISYTHKDLGLLSTGHAADDKQRVGGGGLGVREKKKTRD